MDATTYSCLKCIVYDTLEIEVCSSTDWSRNSQRAPVRYVTKTWSFILLNKRKHILLSQVYCVWQIVKASTIISNNPVYTHTHISHVGVKYEQDEPALNRNTLITVSSFWPNYNHHTRLHLTSCDRLYNHDVKTNVELPQYQLLLLRTIKAYILVMLFICWNNYWDGSGEIQNALSLRFKHTHGGSENVRDLTK